MAVGGFAVVSKEICPERAMVGMGGWHALLVYQYDRPDLCGRWKTARRSTARAKRKPSKHTTNMLHSEYQFTDIFFVLL